MLGGLKEPEFSACKLLKQAVWSASGISPSSLSVDVCLLLFIKPFFLTRDYLPGLISGPRMSCLHRKGLALWQARQVWGKSASWAGCKGLLSA